MKSKLAILHLFTRSGSMLAGLPLPQGVDPAFGIQLLTRTLVLDSIGFGKKKSSAAQVKALDDFAVPLRTM